MRVITVEEHFHHPEAVARVLELGGPSPVPPDAGFGDFLRNFAPDPEGAERLAGRRLEHMDAAGVDIQVVSHGANSPGALDHPESVELCRKVNDALARQIGEHPRRFRGFATIPLHDPVAAADEMKRCVNELGFVGTLTMGTVGGEFLDAERFEPVLAAAEQVDLPIYVHPGLPAGPGLGRLLRRELACRTTFPVLRAGVRLACRGGYPRDPTHSVGCAGPPSELETAQRTLG